MDRHAPDQALARGSRINSNTEAHLMTRLALILTALVLAANAIAGTCYVRKACLVLVNDSALCQYEA